MKIGSWLFRIWAIIAVGVLLAPLSIHLGIFDALRLPALLVGVIWVALLLRRRARAAFLAVSLTFFLATPWAGLGELPINQDSRPLRLVVLPSSSERAIRYAIGEQAELIFIPDLSDATQGAPLDLLAPDYHRQLVNAVEGVGIFVHNSVGQDGDVRILMAAPGSHTMVVSMPFWGTDLTLAAIHLARPFPLAGFGAQARVVDALHRVLVDRPQPVILAGDFNALPWSAASRELAGAIGATHSAWAGTFPASFPTGTRLGLDQVLVGGGLQLVAVETGPDVGSLHLPLIATIALPPR